jgi:Flp pilus assembly protein TadG
MHHLGSAGRHGPVVTHRSLQTGATAVEFALVFPMLFVLFYSVVVYSYLFVLQESISFAAQESAAAAHRVDPVANEDFDGSVRTQVRARAAEVLDWLPASQKARVLGDAACAGGGGEASTGIEVCVNDATNVVRVSLRFDVDGLFPVIRMPLIGELPPMPQFLVGSGTALVGES